MICGLRGLSEGAVVQQKCKSHAKGSSNFVWAENQGHSFHNPAFPLQLCINISQPVICLFDFSKLSSPEKAQAYWKYFPDLADVPAEDFLTFYWNTPIPNGMTHHFLKQLVSLNYSFTISAFASVCQFAVT